MRTILIPVLFLIQISGALADTANPYAIGSCICCDSKKSATNLKEIIQLIDSYQPSMVNVDREPSDAKRIEIAEHTRQKLNSFRPRIHSISDCAARYSVAGSLLKKLSGYSRYLFLTDVAIYAYESELYSQSEIYAKELLHLANAFQKDQDHGNAVHYGNIVLGLVALERKDAELARYYLLQATTSSGSSEIERFGPDFTLARQMIEENEFIAVIDYLNLCRPLWTKGNSQIDQWIALLNENQIPDFDFQKKQAI